VKKDPSAFLFDCLILVAVSWPDVARIEVILPHAVDLEGAITDVQPQA